MEHTKETKGLSRLTSFLLVLAMLIAMFPGVPHAHAAEDDGYTYTLYFKTKSSGEATDEGHLEIPKDDDNHAGGKKLNVTATITDAAGAKVTETDAWVALYRGKHTLESDFTEEELLYDYPMAGKTSGGTAYNGGTIPIGNKSIALYADDYSLVLFRDATDDAPVRIITFTITWDNITETVTKEPTCTEDGEKHQVYEGAWNNKAKDTPHEYDVPIPALGHDYTWTHVEGTATHTGTCSRDASHVLTDDCAYGEDGKCGVCGAAQEVEEADPLIITDKDGNETTTFVKGDPIYVTATSEIGGDWVGLYDMAYPSSSAYWYYVNQDGCVSGQTYNIYDYPNGGWEGYHVGVGTQEIRLVESGVTKTITITAPESTATSLEVEKDTVAAGEPLKIKTTTYTDLAWVAVYPGTHGSSTNFGDLSYEGWYYACGHNGIYREMTLFTPGEYTVVLFADGGYTVDKLVTVTVEEAQQELPPILATDKTEYKFGEPIMVTVNSEAYAASGNDWVGLYKKGEKFDPDNGGVRSIYWYYISDLGATVDINWRTNASVKNENGRDSEFVAGEYTVALLTERGGNWYAEITTVDITITKEEVKRDVTDPTCTEDGSITITYSDGTTETVPGEKATGHAYGETWTYDAENRKHTKTCANDAAHVITENCTFDEGAVTKEPTETETGVKTFTCTVCEGTYTEEIPATGATVVSRETVAPTCTEEGYTLVTYSDGTTEKVDVLPALGHDTEGVAWSHVEGTKTHAKLCKREGCGAAAETADCSFTDTVADGVKTSTCTGCGYSFETVLLLYTDKTEYALGEPIMVTVNNQAYSATAKDWVGIWEADCATDAKVSIYYYYPADQGQTLNIYNAAYHQRDHIAQGDYEIRLFENDGYNMIASVKITVGPAVIDESKTRVVAPTCEEDGYTVYTYTDGTTETVVDEGSALGHAYGETWTYDAENRKHTKTCANDAAHVITENCTFDEGAVTTEPTETEAGVKTFTCTVCKGTYTEEIPATGATEVSRETVAPTCEEEGYTLVTYSDGSTQKIDVLPALGHDWGDWAHVERTRTHTHTCLRSGCGETETEDCVLEYQGVRGDQLECNCRTCGEYFEDLFWTDKEVYASGEDVVVTINPNYDFGSTDWIGLYKAGEKPVQGGLTSIRWDYVGKFANGMSIFQTYWHDRPAEDVDNRLAAGEYWLYLCKNDGYEIVTYISFTVTAVETSRETVAPTCEEDGYVLAHYSDGTSKVVVTAEEDPSLKATGHAYGDWAYDAANKKHVKTCANDETHVLTEGCTFDEGTVTKEPTATEKGEKTFTCTVCHGTYTQELAATGVELVKEETTKEPTCTEEGVKTAYYSDGSTIDTPIPALGHSFEGAQWTYNNDRKTHSRACVRGCGHTETGDCDMVLDEGKGTFNCAVCGGSYVAFIITTDKTEYKFGEPIYVTVNTDAYEASDLDWVGLYKKGESVDPNNGGVVSIYWYYVGDFDATVDINWRTNPAVKNDNSRDPEFGPGEYSVVLLANDGYGVIASVDITITADEIDLDGNTYALEINGEAVEDGEKLTFTMGDEIVLKPTVEGMAGSGWIGVYIAGYGRGHDFSTTPSDWWDYFYNINGTEINLADKIGLEAGHYTVVLFGDAGYANVKYLMNFEIQQETEEYEVIKEPTCTMPGSAKVKYVGAEDYVFVPIPALGHDFVEGVCTRCGAEDPDYTDPSDPSEPVDPSEPEDPSEPSEPGETELLRLAGSNRITTSLLTADQLKAEMGVDKFDAVVLASGLNFPDALSGSYLAAVKNAPILLTAKGFEAEVNAYITENLAEGGTVYVLGGEAAVPEALLQGLTGVQRVAGANRFETNLEILKTAGVNGSDILVCTAMNFPDSLSAAAAQKPILLVGDKLTAEQEAFLKLLGDKNYYIIGGTGAVSKAVEHALQNYGGTNRLAGNNRYDTSVLIAKTFFGNAEKVVLAYGMNYPDGLCGGALAAAMNGPVILVQDGFIDQASAYIRDKGIAEGYILGGTGLISDASIREIWELADDTVIPEKK